MPITKSPSHHSQVQAYKC